MLITLSQQMKNSLIAKGIESFHSVGLTNISDQATFEPPCGIKWMQIENNFSMGAFSYAVSGFFSEVSIGRYTSIGEQVQIGRANHAMTWVSTSPFFYLQENLFSVGNEFQSTEDYSLYRAPHRPNASATSFRPIKIGNDVWIGHGALIMPGVTVGDGAVIGAMSVVTKDVPPYGIVTGNPAILQRMRLEPVIVAALLKSQWWQFAPWQLVDVDFTEPFLAVEQLKSVVSAQPPYRPEPVTVAELATK